MQPDPSTANNTSDTGSNNSPDADGNNSSGPDPSNSSPAGPQDPASAQRNFDSISPSAYSLLLMKGLTSIPYAREAAELLVAPKPYEPDISSRPALFWGRLVHFENRYWSIDQLMRDLSITNILEISSGFSFRGLAWSQQAPVHYIDTDLPELIATKKQFVEALIAADENPAFAAATAAARQYADYQPTAQHTSNHHPEPQPSPTAGHTTNQHPDPETAPTAEPPPNQDPEPQPSPAQPPPSHTPPASAGHYSVTALNALDTTAFDALVDTFPPGPLLIVNEGLLMYLDKPEKEQLCRNILQALRRRGGYWITVDIYIQKELDPALIDSGDSLQQFLQQHKVEEKKFRDFESAAAFFTGMGFIIEKEAVRDRSKLSSLPHLLAATPPELHRRLASMPRMQATWRLRPAPSSAP